MPLQTENLVMVGLGVEDDTPPNSVQPPLADGIHLRWAFKRDLGFPWYGFHLFRRPHLDGPLTCISTQLVGLSPGIWPEKVMPLASFGEVSSNVNLSLLNQFPGPTVEFGLSSRTYLRFSFPNGFPARRIKLEIGFVGTDTIEVNAFFGKVSVASELVKGNAGTISTVIFEFDAITAVQLSGGSATLVEFCFRRVDTGATVGWTQIPGFTYPLCLPVAHPDYICQNAPLTATAAQTMALDRISYGSSTEWEDQPFDELHAELKRLVDGGPAAGAMADRSQSNLLGEAAETAVNDQPPRMPNLYDLDLVLLAALNPAAAQMVGLAWVDTTAPPLVAFDYLIVGDFSGVLTEFDSLLNGQLEYVLSAGTYGYIVFNQQRAPATSLEPPRNLQVFSLPGATIGTQDGGVRDVSNNSGLRWNRGVIEISDDPLSLAKREVLLPGEPIMYHVWRADLGDEQPEVSPAKEQFELLTEKTPLLLTDSKFKLETKPERAPGWPDFRMFSIDMGLIDGWYSYQVNGIDIFGRHSENSVPAEWHQWSPQPLPRPWYYEDPPGDRVVHNFAIGLLDKIPPPPPTSIEAHALDPADPYLVRDGSFQQWRESLSQEEQGSIIGLRIRWQWTEAQMRQASDIREFRIYFNSGTKLPTPDRSKSRNWEERIYVVGFDEHLAPPHAGDPPGLRRYQLFLPAPSDVNRNGLRLSASLANPVVYAHIGVTSSDDKVHSLDHPKWSSGNFGGSPRFGNEGVVGAPIKIFRVLRDKPNPPQPPPDSERVFATPADYHSRSFYTYRWRPTEHLRTHVFRALDESVFKADWKRRPREPLDTSQHVFFPDESTDSRWVELKRQQVSDELNQLNGFSQNEAGTSEAMSFYRTLSNDGLRVLAGLPGVERAFSQITIKPLDPDDSNNANKVGPDNPSDFSIEPQLRSYVDIVDGRSTNRYFYRAAYVDGAQNQSALSLSGPPIWLPNVVPPRTPTITKVLGGERQIILRWASNRELDLASYEVFRTNTKESARDLRLMTLVHTELVTETDPHERPAEVVWTDDSVAGLQTFFYRITAVDNSGNRSAPSNRVSSRAFDQTPPEAPTWISAGWSVDGTAVELSWSFFDPALETVVLRKHLGFWQPSSPWLPSGETSYSDFGADDTIENRYRLRVRSKAGNVNLVFVETIVPPI